MQIQRRNNHAWQGGVALSAILTLALVGCGSSSSGDSNEDSSGDGAAPTVSSTTPINQATNVSRNIAVTATFNEDMFAKTVKGTSFTVRAGSNAPGNVSFDALSNIASFTPTQPLLPITSYTATLSTAITDLSGIPLSSPYTSSFTTVDGAWGNAERIDGTHLDRALRPQVAFDASGNATAVWYQTDITNRVNITANRYTADTDSWSGIKQIESSSAKAYYPQIAINANGDAMVVWYQRGSNREIWANRYTASTDSWDTAERIDADTADAKDQQVAIDTSGNALAVWEQGDDIWANRYTASTQSWGTAERIETGAESAERPQIAVDGSGNALAVWEQRESSKYIFASRYTISNGSWNSPQRIDTVTQNSSAPQIAFGASGNALAVWQKTSGFRQDIKANRYIAETNSWSGATLVSDGTESTISPQIAIDGSGNAMAVWAQSVGGQRDVWANHYTDSTDNWGTSKRIDTDDVSSAKSPQIGVDASGNALAVWQQGDSTLDNIWGSRYTASIAEWGTAELIQANDASHAERPEIAIDASGNALAVWLQDVGGEPKVFAKRFE